MNLLRQLHQYLIQGIIPIPKAKQTQVESDTRPIALIPVLSKVLQDFVVSWMVSTYCRRANR
jgi:hypothetical protein